MFPSSVSWPPGQHAGRIASFLLVLAEKFRLVRLQRETGSSPQGRAQIVGTTNLTLLNALLVLIGVRGPVAQPGQVHHPLAPCKPEEVSGPIVGERELFLLVMLVQLLGSAVAFVIRHFGAVVFYPIPTS